MTDQLTPIISPDPQRERANQRPDPRPKSFYGAPYPSGGRPDSMQSGAIELSDQEREIARRHREHDEHIRANVERVAAEQSVAAIKAQAEQYRANENLIIAYLRSKYPGSDENFSHDYQHLHAALMAKIIMGEVSMSDIARQTLQAGDYRSDL
jgi:hypothetical protein